MRRPIHYAVLALLTAALAPAHVGAETGASLLFVSNRGGNAQIYRMEADGSGQRVLTGTAEENTEPAWSPDGRHIAFTSYRDGNAEIYVMNADGSGPQRLTREPMADSVPSWTPDGRILFRSMRDRWANFYLMNADGSQLQQLSATPMDKGNPLLSPDGCWIAFVAYDEKNSSEIYLMPVEGGEAINLTASSSNNQKLFPTWAPDSRRLAYVEAKGQSLNVRVVGVDGGVPVKITDNPYANALPVWSPDGQRMAFVSSRDVSPNERARGDIYVMNADGSEALNLSRHPDEDTEPVWLADGRSIVFVSLRDGTAQLYAVPADGGEARRLTVNQAHDLMARPQPAAHSSQKAQPARLAAASIFTTP